MSLVNNQLEWDCSCINQLNSSFHLWPPLLFTRIRWKGTEPDVTRISTRVNIIKEVSNPKLVHLDPKSHSFLAHMHGFYKSSIIHFYSVCLSFTFTNFSQIYFSMR